ncbi:uncharacterized protein LOC108949339 [Ciona intestinalis]
MSDFHSCAWNVMVSANKRTELKYRNVHPALKCCLGCKQKVVDRSIRQKIKKQTTLLELMSDNYEGFQFQSIADLTFLPQSDFVVASEFATVNHPNGRVTVFGQKGEVKITFPPQDRGKNITLYGVTSIGNSDEHVAICTGDGVSVWTVDGRIVSYLTHATVHNCCHVASLNNGLLATTCMTEYEDRLVTIWDPRNGRITSQFGSRPEVLEVNPLKQLQRILVRDKDIRLPWFIAADSELNVHISDRTSQCVKVFDSRNGRYERRYDIAGVNNRCRKGSLLPQGICMDEDDNAFVVNDLTNTVAIFDRHGEHVRDLSMEESSPKESKMWSLALSKYDKVQFPQSVLVRNQMISPARKIALSMSRRKPQAFVYNLSFCKHYSIGF